MKLVKDDDWGWLLMKQAPKDDRFPGHWFVVVQLRRPWRGVALRPWKYRKALR